ncbi:AN1-type zinc finger protein 6 isoform 2-T4 [Discoglossus pictus]
MNMAQETNHSQAPLLCSTGCGFYGNPRTNGLCSVCYKEHLQRQNSGGRNSPPVVAVGAGTEVSSTQQVDGSQAADVEEPVPSQTTQASSLPLLEDTVSSSQAENTESRTAETEISDCSDTGRFSDKGFSYSSIDKGGAQPSVLEEGSRKGKRKLNETDLKLDSAEASASDSAQNSSEEQERSPEKSKLKKKNRCFMCRKKTGLTGFECRCGNVFCGTHRYSDVHSCSYDYKADAAEKIRKENPVVVGEKIQKI